jgi:hypothetical protein
MRSQFLVLLASVLAAAVDAKTNSTSNCVVPHTPNADDSPAIMEVFGRCNANSTIVFSAGVEYNAWTPMRWTNLCAYYVWHPRNCLTDRITLFVRPF